MYLHPSSSFGSPARQLRRGSVRHGTVRRGLAPVEFVLWLPVLLFVMALMVNYGTMAAWRIRGEIAAHDAGWRTRWPRQGGGEPDPAPTTAVVTRTETVHQDPALAFLDPPQLQAPVVRGPLPNGFVVNQLLDPLPGAVSGNAHVERRYPLLSRAGSFASGPIDEPMLHGSRTNGEMGMPNWHRRLRELYQLPQTDPSLPGAFRDAVLNVLSIPSYDGLYVLDRDADWIEYRGYAPDFHPRIRQGCSLDRDQVRRREVNRLIDVWDTRRSRWRLGQISRLPRTLTGSFLSMFQSTLAQFQAELESDPPPPPARLQYLQTHIPILERKIEQLQDFQQRIGQFESQLASRPPPMN